MQIVRQFLRTATHSVGSVFAQSVIIIAGMLTINQITGLIAETKALVEGAAFVFDFHSS